MPDEPAAPSAKLPTGSAAILTNQGNVTSEIQEKTLTRGYVNASKPVSGCNGLCPQSSKEKEIISPPVWEQSHPELLLPQHIARPGCSVPRGQHPIPPPGARAASYLARTTEKRKPILYMNAMRKRIKKMPDSK